MSTAPPSTKRGGGVWWALLSPAAALVLFRATAPPSFYDALVYHLGLPQQFAARGAAVVDVHDMYTALPLLAEMAASPALLLGGTRGPEAFGFVYALEWVLLVAAAHAFARRAFRDVAGAGAACAFAVASMPLAVFLPSGTKPDLLAALLALGALAAVVALFDHVHPARGALLRFGALCAGLGCATKTTFLAWTAILAAAVVVRAVAARRSAAPVRFTARDTAIAAAIVVVTGCFPYVRNAIALGAPLYPFAGGPPFAAHTRELLAADAHRPQGVLDVLALPYTLAVQNDPTADELLGLVFWVGLLALAVFRPAKGPTRRALVVVAGVAAATLPVWLFTHALPRYDPLLWLAIGLGAGVGLAAARRALPPLIAPLAAAAVVLAALVDLSWNLVADDHLLRGNTRAVLQQVPRDRFVAGALELAPAYAFLGAAHARCAFLVTGDARIAYLDVPAVLSEAYTRPVFDEYVSEAARADDVVARVRATGASHVLLARNALAAAHKRGWAQLDDDGAARFDGFVRALGPPVYEDAVARVFAVPGAIPGPCAP